MLRSEGTSLAAGVFSLLIVSEKKNSNAAAENQKKALIRACLPVISYQYSLIITCSLPQARFLIPLLV